MPQSKRVRRDLEELQRQDAVASIATSEDDKDVLPYDCRVRLPRDSTCSSCWCIGLELQDFPLKAPKVSLLAPHPLHPLLQAHGPSLLNPHMACLQKDWSPRHTLWIVINAVIEWIIRQELPSCELVENHGDPLVQAVHHEKPTKDRHFVGITYFQNVSQHYCLQLHGLLNSVDVGNDWVPMGRGTVIFPDDDEQEQEKTCNETSSTATTKRRQQLILKPGERVGFGNAILRSNSCFIGERILLVETILEPTASQDKTPIALLFEEWLLSWDGTARRLKSTATTPVVDTIGAGRPQRGGVRATHWGITLRQIRELLEETGLLPSTTTINNNNGRQSPTSVAEDLSVYQFVESYIKPITANRGMGYALWINRASPLEVQVMCSHTWQEGILEFYHALRTTLDEDTPLFVCFLSIYQNSEGEFFDGVTIDQQLGNDPLRGPFAQVLHNFKNKPSLRLSRQDMRQVKRFDREYATESGYRSKPHMSCGYMVVVPTQYANIYSRMWCCLELFTAAKEGVPIFITKQAMGILDRDVSTRTARCGLPSDVMNRDEILIRAAIEGGVGYDFVDEFIAGFTAIHAKRGPPAPQSPIMLDDEEDTTIFLSSVGARVLASPSDMACNNDASFNRQVGAISVSSSMGNCIGLPVRDNRGEIEQEEEAEQDDEERGLEIPAILVTESADSTEHVEMAVALPIKGELG
ncbi:expressed unknown protein [Seminavis robusta]|uniref:Uncharacterized protein n=1 Tax=Seminavis robusta TaxID=568900 RepID=A0A9N8HDL6_9STRA|nr:expressed unknown protein [Seminavis robusta]|eukprot:Sro264_g102630.1 n/a (695) ;mRNA; f:63816-65900